MRTLSMLATESQSIHSNLIIFRAPAASGYEKIMQFLEP